MVGVKRKTPVKWKDRVLEHVKELKGRSENEKSKACKDRDKWIILTHGHPLGESSSERESYIDRYFL